MTGRKPTRDEAPLAFLRRWVAPESWRPLGPNDDYRVFGDLWLSDLRDALSECAADTARLDWLTRNGWAEIMDVEHGVQVGDVYAPDADTRTLRDAIDEAMREA